MVTIVEQPAVPLIMASPATRVEVLVIGAVEFVQTIKNILGGMAMDDIQKDDKAQAVGGVDELLQVFRRTVPTARCKEVVDLVAETGIIGMLHDGHELDNVVAEALDSWEHVLGEFLVGGDSELGRRDTNVCLIHTNTGGLLWSLVFEDIPLLLGRVPEPCIICW